MGLALGMLVNRKNEVLLLQHALGEVSGRWSLPQGEQIGGEDLKQTATRAVLEQTSIKMRSRWLYLKSQQHNVEVWRGRRRDGRAKVQGDDYADAKYFRTDMLPHDDDIASKLDRRVIARWAADNPESRRVHHPHSKMGRAGFMLLLNDEREVLLLRKKTGRRLGRWGLPGGDAITYARLVAATRLAEDQTGLEFEVGRRFYHNRHSAKVWLGYTEGTPLAPRDGRWFPLDALPDDDSLAFAIDVRTMEKWADENPGSSRIPVPPEVKAPLNKYFTKPMASTG